MIKGSFRSHKKGLHHKYKKTALNPCGTLCEWHEGELEESDMPENGEEAEDGEDGNKDSNISALTGASKLRRLSRNWIAMRRLQAHFR
jgi:hypothetical protein